MGEIGYNRHEFLYDLRLWEIQLIVMGYRNRDRLTNQLLAESVYATIHVMRDPKGKTVRDIFPMLFENDDNDEMEPILTDEECAGLQADMDAWNAQHQGETQP